MRRFFEPQPEADPDNPARAVEALDRLLAGFVWTGLLAILAIVPWIVTAVHAWVVAGLCVAVAVGITAWLFCSRRGLVPSLTIVLLCGILLGLLQLVPIPRGTLATLSPAASRWRDDLFYEITNQDPTTPAPVSLYPGATRHMVVMLVVATGVFLLGSRFVITPRSRLALFGTLAVVGAALTMLGLIQMMTSREVIYWFIPITQRSRVFGPFVSSNHAANFLNLCLGGAIGLWSCVSARRSTGPLERGAGWSSGGGALASSLKQRVGDFFANLNATQMVVLCLLIVVASGVVATASRGGFVALLVGLVVVAGAAWRVRRGLPPLLLLVIAAGAFALLAWLGISEKVGGRLETIVSGEAAEDTRVQIWREALATASDYWRTGSGLGTFQWVFEIYRRHPGRSAWFTHAENQFLDAAIVAGLPGLLLLLAVLAMAFAATARLLASATPDRTILALALTGLFGLTSQTVQGCFDFALYMPANMYAVALVCGALVGAAVYSVPHGGEGPGAVFAPRASRHFASPLACVMLFALAIGWHDSIRLAHIDTLLRELRGRELDETYTVQLAEEDRARLLAQLENRWDHAQGHLRVAELAVRQFRLETLEKIRQQAGGSGSDEEDWARTSTSTLHREVHRLLRENQQDSVQAIWADLAGNRRLVEAAQHLSLSCRACPIMATPYVGLAEVLISPAALAREEQLLERARAISPVDTSLLYYTALLDWDAGRRGPALATWRRCWELSPQLAENILSSVRDQISDQELVEQLVPEKALALIWTARQEFPESQLSGVRERLLAKTARLLAEVPQSTASNHYARAWMQALQARDAANAHDLLQAAAESFRLAIRLRPDDDVWRYEFGQFLLEQHQVEEALRQFRWANRLRPGPQYRAAIQRAEQMQRAAR